MAKVSRLEGGWRRPATGGENLGRQNAAHLQQGPKPEILSRCLLSCSGNIEDCFDSRRLHLLPSVTRGDCQSHPTPKALPRKGLRRFQGNCRSDRRRQVMPHFAYLGHTNAAHLQHAFFTECEGRRDLPHLGAPARARS